MSTVQNAAHELTPEGVRAAYEALERAMPEGGASAEAWLAWYREWNAFKCRVDGERARRNYRSAQDTRDEAAETALREHREQIQPAIEAGEGRLRPRFLASPQRPALEAALGRQFFARLEEEQAAFAPANIPLHVEEGEASSQYQRLLGSAAIAVGDETLTMTRALARLGDPDPQVRRAVWDAFGAWMEQHRAELHGHYDRLVSLRHRMAASMGLASFVPLGYRRMGRTDYGPAEVAVLRDSIETHVVPVLAALRAEQARQLGVDAVKPWDAAFFPGLSLGPNVVPVASQLDQAQHLFDRLHPTLAGHFRRMAEGGLIDLENRPGKRAGAFACTFEDEGQVAIFCNSTGAESDVTTLIHEMGHAFQGWESRWIEPLEVRWPTLDACEVHSMGLEFLALKEITAFFSPEQAARYRRLKLINTIQRLPYMAMVDAFQHWVYEHPDHSRAEREAHWDALWARFQPGVDYTGEEAHRQYRWMRQQHIFVAPFYYIDYAIAEVGAMQLWQMAEQDHDQAMKTYLALCHLGGTKSTIAMFESAGLRSPFEAGVLQPLMAKVSQELALV